MWPSFYNREVNVGKIPRVAKPLFLRAAVSFGL